MGREDGNFDAYIYNPEAYNKDLLRRLGGATYRGRRLILRDTDVRKKVFYEHAEESTEAIYVDTDDSPAIYADYVNAVIDKSRNERGGVMRPRIPWAVYDTVVEKMPGSRVALGRLYQRLKVARGSRVGLSEFMREGAGVCRHKAIACAVVLEILGTGNFASHRISVDSSQRFHEEDGEPCGGHMWARYEDLGGVWILDPAQHYFGLLEDSIDAAGWDYFRPEDEDIRQAALQRTIAKTGLKAF